MICPSRAAWLAEADFNAYAAALARSDFRGGLSYYRSLDRNWQLQASLESTRVEVPARFVIEARDVGLSMPGMGPIIAAMPTLVPRLRPPLTIDDAGHWLQQERADTVNALILSFVASLPDQAGRFLHLRRSRHWPVPDAARVAVIG